MGGIRLLVAVRIRISIDKQMAYLTLNCVMRQILKPALIFSFIIFTLFTASAQQIEFLQNKNSAGKASLTSDAYYSSFTLGTANFSP